MIENEVTKTMLSRFSCRQFSNKPVEKEKLETIINAAKYAPNGRNAQAWHFTVVNTDGGKELLLKAAGETPPPDFPEGMSWPFQADFCGAPTVIMISTAMDVPYPDVGAHLAAENLIIAATSLGLATLWSSAFTKDVFRDEKSCEVKHLLMPEENKVMATLFVGYPVETPTERPERRANCETWL